MESSVLCRHGIRIFNVGEGHPTASILGGSRDAEDMKIYNIRS